MAAQEESFLTESAEVVADTPSQDTTPESALSTSAAEAAAKEAAEAAKAAAEAAIEAAKRAEELAVEAAKVAEAAAAEKLRLEEEAAALKIKEFVDAQTELYREIYSQLPKVHTHICLRIEEIIRKDFLSVDDLSNNKLKDALKDLNENCTSAFDEYINSKESNNNTSGDVVQANGETDSQIMDDKEDTKCENESDVNTDKVEQIEMEVKTIKEEKIESEGGEKAVEPASVNNTEQNDQTVDTTQAMDTSTVNEATSATSMTTTPKPKVKSNVDALSSSLFKWKRNNKEKLTPGAGKGQNQSKKDRRSMERPGPNAEKLKEILARTGYSHEISSGQRKYGGPPPNWIDPNTTTETAAATVESTETIDEVKMEQGSQVIEGGEAVKKEPTCVPVLPPHGCECFVGKLPRDLFEDELIPVFEKYGRIWDLRLMIDPSSGFSKGYCFVTYCEKNDALAAAKALNDFEIRPGKEMRVNISVANIKLFIGNIPKTKSKEEIKAEFSKVVEGLAEVIIYNQGETENEKVKNRGFCFLEFIDHKSASVAKRKLGSPRFNRVFNREIAVDWADPNDEPDEETMAKVKVLYVKNLGIEVTEEEVQKVFEAYGKLERVRKMKDYAFVHFDQREDAVKAMEEQNNNLIGKLPMEISLARPLTEKKKQAQQKRMEGGRGGNHMHNNNNNQHWNNNNGNNFNQNRPQNRQNFNNNGGNRGQMNGFNGGQNGNRGNHAGNRGNFGGMHNGNNNNGGMGRIGNMGNRGGFNQNRGQMNGGHNNFNGNNGFNNNNNQRNNNGMNNGRQGGQGNFRGNNHRGGGNMGNSFNGNGSHQMMNKRKNNDNFMNGDNGQKKGRFNNNGNGNMNGNGHFNNGMNGQLLGQNFAGNGNGNWNNFGGMQQQGNDASNEFYQDNFNSNQWQ